MLVCCRQQSGSRTAGKADALDPAGLEIIGRVNAQVRQHSYTRDLLFPIPHLIEHVSAMMTLEPGDILLSGTPAGVGPLQPGDIVEVEIPGIGVLRNPVVADVNQR